MSARSVINNLNKILMMECSIIQIDAFKKDVRVDILHKKITQFNLFYIKD